MKGISLTDKVLLYIESNLHNDLTIEKIARELNYSKFYIARTFKECTGYTIYKYIQGKRLHEAAQKLVETSQPIVEIALEAGYGSHQAFTQAFHNTYQCTPQEYRKAGVLILHENRITIKNPAKIQMFSCGRIENMCAA